MIALLYSIRVTSMGMHYLGGSLTREILGYVSTIVRDAVVTDHLLSEPESLYTLSIYNLNTKKRRRREEGIVMACGKPYRA